MSYENIAVRHAVNAFDKLHAGPEGGEKVVLGVAVRRPPRRNAIPSPAPSCARSARQDRARSRAGRPEARKGSRSRRVHSFRDTRRDRCVPHGGSPAPRLPASLRRRPARPIALLFPVERGAAAALLQRRTRPVEPRADARRLQHARSDNAVETLARRSLHHRGGEPVIDVGVGEEIARRGGSRRRPPARPRGPRPFQHRTERAGRGDPVFLRITHRRCMREQLAHGDRIFRIGRIAESPPEIIRNVAV